MSEIDKIIWTVEKVMLVNAERCNLTLVGRSINHNICNCQDSISLPLKTVLQKKLFPKASFLGQHLYDDRGAMLEGSVKYFFDKKSDEGKIDEINLRKINNI